MSYTVPANNAVNFELTVYTVPANNAVNFEFSTGPPPTVSVPALAAKISAIAGIIGASPKGG